MEHRPLRNITAYLRNINIPHILSMVVTTPHRSYETLPRCGGDDKAPIVYACSSSGGPVHSEIGRRINKISAGCSHKILKRRARGHR